MKPLPDRWQGNVLRQENDSPAWRGQYMPAAFFTWLMVG